MKVKAKINDKKIKKFVQAYTSCIAGAMRKEEYIGLIKDAGFQNVDIQGEEFFSLDLESEEGMIKATAEETRIAVEQLKELAHAVSSIKISAAKPKK